MRWVVNRWVKSCNNFSITYFNDDVDNIILDAEGNECGIIYITILESNFENDHIHVLHYLPKQ